MVRYIAMFLLILVSVAAAASAQPPSYPAPYSYSRPPYQAPYPMPYPQAPPSQAQFGIRCATQFGICVMRAPGPLGYGCSCPGPFGLVLGTIVN